MLQHDMEHDMEHIGTPPLFVAFLLDPDPQPGHSTVEEVAHICTAVPKIRQNTYAEHMSIASSDRFSNSVWISV